MISQILQKANPITLIILIIFAATGASDTQASQRTMLIGPLSFESQQELLSFLPTIDIGTKKSFGHDYVPPSPCPIQVKGRLFASPGYMLSHHTLYLEMTYDDAQIKPGAIVPVSLRAVPAGSECFLKSGGGAIAEAKWRIGSTFLWIGGDIPYLPNFDLGFQAHVENYAAPMPNAGFKAGARSSLGSGLEIPLYQVGSQGKIFLKLKPGLFFKLGFKDLTGNMTVVGSDSLTLGGSEVLTGIPVTLAKSDTTAQTFLVKLPDDLTDTSDFSVLLSSIGYQDELKVSPIVGFCLGVSVSLTSSDDEGDDEEAGGNGEPPDGEDNDYEIEASSEAFDFGEVSLSLSSIGYTTPTATWDLGALPGVGNLFQFGWDLPLNKQNGEGEVVIPPLPDLVVPAASASASGAQFNVSAEVDNQGTGSSSAFKVKWYVEQANGSAISGVSNPVWTDTINSMATGGYQTLTHSRDALPTGEYRVRILADPDGSAPYYQVTELCEINNQGVATFSSTLDLSAQFTSTFLYQDSACTQASPTTERIPGRQYYVKATVSRRATDVPVANVPVEFWVRRHNYPWWLNASGQGAASPNPEYQGEPILIARQLVDLSSTTSVTLVFPWAPAARLDSPYELRLKVDPEGQFAQHLPADADTGTNDQAWAWMVIERPHVTTWGEMLLEPGAGLTTSTWGIGKAVTYKVQIKNDSRSNAHSVPVQMFVAGRMIGEQVIDIPSGTCVWVQQQAEFTRDQLCRDNFLGGGLAAPWIIMGVKIDPRNEVEDREDYSVWAHTRFEYQPAPPIGNLAIDVAMPEEMYTGESHTVSANVSNYYIQSFTGGTLGKVPVSMATVIGEGEAHQEAMVAHGDVSVGAAQWQGWHDGAEWYTPAVGSLPNANWVPQQPGQYLFVATLDPPVAPGHNSDDDIEKYVSDVQLYDNTVAKIATIGMPRPDPQATKVYIAAMPTRSDLADLRRFSERIAMSLSGSPRAKEMLAVSKNKPYAGAPVTIALDIANPQPSPEYPVVPAPSVRVNFYAVYQPAWQSRPVLADLIEQWREIRDEQLPALGRPVRQIALYNNEGAPSAGLRMAPTNISISTPSRSVRIGRPLTDASGRRSTFSSLNPFSAQYKGRTALDLLREFNQKQAEVLVIGTCFLDRIEQGAVASCQWVPPHGGKWLISAQVDPDELLFERDETNNSAEMILDVRPSPHYFVSTPPCAIAGVRLGRGAVYSAAVESALERLAGPEAAAPKVTDLFPVDGTIKSLWDELRTEAEALSVGMPALTKRRTLSIKQGQTFTLIGSRTIDREHDVVTYLWTGPNVTEAGSNPDLMVDTSRGGYELSPGVHRYTLTAIDAAGFSSNDNVFVTVTSGAGNSADLVPVALSSLPNPLVAGCATTLTAVVQNQGVGNTDKTFKVRLSDGNKLISEQTISTSLNGGDVVEVAFADIWTPTAGLHNLKVQVDTTNKVAESSESNNTLTVSDRVDANARPLADLGASEFVVKVGEGLFFDAYRSFDPDGSIITYRWFIDGQEQSGYHGRRFRYEAPSTAGNHKVKLIVVDNNLPTPKISEPVEATIHVVSDRQRTPVARLMPRMVVRRGRRITIPATGCYDPDGTLAAYAWKLKGAVNLTGNGSDFNLDTSKLEPGRYTVELTVTDNAGAKAVAAMPLYVVETPNRAPVIQLPVAVSVVKGEPAKIDASRSYDVDGTIAEYLWIVPKNNYVTTGPNLQLDTADLGVGAHVVVLAVSDNLGATTTRATTLWVLPTKNQPQLSETGYDEKSMTKEQVKDAEISSGKEESGSVKPPSGAKQLQDTKESELPSTRK